MLEISLNNSGIDTFIEKLISTNEDALETESNLRKKLKGATSDADFWEKEFLNEVKFHNKTKDLLRYNIKRIDEYRIKLDGIKLKQRKTLIVVGSVATAFVGGLIAAHLLK